MFKTRFTEMLGVQYPIQCGTMMFISNADFVAACANAGIFSCLASAMFPSEEKLTDEIRRLKNLTDQPFGVNISLFRDFSPCRWSRAWKSQPGRGFEFYRPPATIRLPIVD